MKSKRKISILKEMLYGVILLGLGLLLPLSTYFISRIGIHKIYEGSYIYADNMGMNVDEVKLHNNELVINGGCWFYDCSSDINMYNKSIFFINEENGEVFCGKLSPIYSGTRYTESIDNGIVYQYAGLTGRLDVERLDVENNNYRIYYGLIRDGANWLCNTNLKIINGEIEEE